MPRHKNWFEVFKSTEEGTNTIETFNKLPDAICKLKKLRQKNRNPDIEYFIDEWSNKGFIQHWDTDDEKIKKMIRACKK